MSSRALLLLGATLLVVGCAKVQVDQVKGLAGSGMAYTETLKKVNEYALDKSIQFSADILPTLPRDLATLEAHSNGIRDRTQLVAEASAYLDGLAAYFSELEDLANGDPSEAMMNSLGAVADGLKKEPIGLKISDDRTKAYRGFASYVAKQVHANAVERALIRDAGVVARALAICEDMLDNQIEWVTLRAKAERTIAYREKVQKPYLAGELLGTEWKDSWSAGVRKPPEIKFLEDARKASKTMQGAWVNLLRGSHSFAALNAELKTINEGLDVLKTLKNAK